MKERIFINKGKYCIAILLVLITWKVGIAQDGSYKTDLPSPTAASLASEAETSVNLFKGLPSINIPLYEMKRNELSIPLSLSYNPEAIRVQNIPDWVGLGWSLHAGGAITRVKRGNPDERSNGYINTGDDYDLKHFNSLSGNEQYSFITEDLKTSVDPEPDVFYYNFAGYSGKFLIAPGGTVHSIPQNNLKIEVGTISSGNIQGFTVYSPEGTEYGFSRKEMVKQTGESITQNDYYNAWYLTKVEGASSNADITLEYSNQISVTHLSPLYEAKYQSLGGSNTPDNIAKTGLSKYERIYLERIKTDDKKVVFHRSKRDDALHYDTNLQDRRQEYRLDSLVIRDISENKREKSVKFNYSYHSNRLFLEEVQTYGQNGSSKPAYKFTYKNWDSLPDRLSYSVDYWGYFNNRSNNTFIPSVFFTHTVYTDNYYKGADRSTNANYVDYGVLTKIEYPTGGSTEFEYEPHEYGKVLFPPNADLLKLQTQTVWVPNDGTGVETRNFSINADTQNDSYVDLRIKFMLDSMTGVYVELYEQGNSSPLRTYYPSSSEEVINDEFFLPDGSYYIEAKRADNDNLIIGDLSIHTEKNVDKKVGGGIRLKKMIQHDGMNTQNDIVKHYEYGDPQSGVASYGVLYTEPDNDYIFQSGKSGTATDGSYNFYARVSTPIKSFGAEGRRFIGYEKVIVNYGANGDKGTEEHIYNIDPGFTSHISSTYYPGWDSGVFIAQPDLSYRLGRKKEKRVIDNGSIIKTENFSYTFNDDFMLNDVDYIDQNVSPERYKQFPAMAYHEFDDHNFKYRYYRMYAPWVYRSSKEVKTSEGTTDTISTKIKYLFSDPSHKLITEKTETNSNGQVRKTKYKYAHEVQDHNGPKSGGSDYTSMKTLNMLTQPYSVTIMDSTGTVLSKQWTLWKQASGTGWWHPLGKWVWTGGNPEIPNFNN